MQTLFSFHGRLNRMKFWLIPIAVDIVVSVVLGILVVMGGGSMDRAADGTMPPLGGGIVGSIVAFVVVVAAAWIGLAVGVKRYHDRGKSGWGILITLGPVIGGLL